MKPLLDSGGQQLFTLWSKRQGVLKEAVAYPRADKAAVQDLDPDLEWLPVMIADEPAVDGDYYDVARHAGRNPDTKTWDITFEKSKRDPEQIIARAEERKRAEVTARALPEHATELLIVALGAMLRVNPISAKDANEQAALEEVQRLSEVLLKNRANLTAVLEQIQAGAEPGLKSVWEVKP